MRGRQNRLCSDVVGRMLGGRGRATRRRARRQPAGRRPAAELAAVDVAHSRARLERHRRRSKAGTTTKDGSTARARRLLQPQHETGIRHPGRARTTASRDRAAPIRGSRRISCPAASGASSRSSCRRTSATRRLTWTIVANGFTNTITLHTQADYIVEPYEDAANKNTPPVLKFQRRRPDVHRSRRTTIAEKFTATVGTPLALTVWATDEGPKINIPERARTAGAAPQAGSNASGRVHAAAAAGPHLVDFRGRGRR